MNTHSREDDALRMTLMGLKFREGKAIKAIAMTQGQQGNTP
jgi:hypothetical protein